MTIFSKIIKGELPSYKIAENEKFYAFLDIYPLQVGHTLVVPKIEVDKLYHLPDTYLSELLLFTRPIATAIEQCFDCKRCGYSVVGLEINHAHVHLIPINNISDMDFGGKKLSISSKEFQKIQSKIVNKIKSMTE